MFTSCSSVRPSTAISLDAISLLCSIKLATNIQHVTGNCRKGLQGQRLKVKVMTTIVCNGGGIYFDGVASRLTCCTYL